MKRVLVGINTTIGLLCIVAMLGVVVGLPLYLEVSGIVAPGTVVAKREVIKTTGQFWSRHLFVDVRYQPTNEETNTIASVAVQAATYDDLHVGAPVELRYAPNATLRVVGNIANTRLMSQPPFGSFFALLGTFLPGIVVGIIVWLVLLALWSRWPRWWLGVPIFLVMLVSGLIIGSGWQPAPSGTLVAATGMVREVKRIDRVWGGDTTPAEDAVQPFLIVQVVFVPAGRSDPVVAVDVIDDTGVAALQPAATVALHYSAADPRHGQIDGATRTYYWKNLRSFAFIALALIALLCGSWYIKVRRAARQTPRASAP